MMTDLEQLDAIDLRILSELQNDGRIRNNELANRVGVFTAALFAAGEVLGWSWLHQIDSSRARRKAARLRSRVIHIDSTGTPGSGDFTGIRKHDCCGAVCSAVLANIRRYRLLAEMHRAQS